MSSEKSTLAYPAVILATFLWGFIGLPSRNLDNAGFTPMEVTLLRTAIGAAVLFVVMLVLDRKGFAVRPKDLWIFVACAAFKVLVDLLLFEAQIRVDLSLATVLQMTSPYFVLLFSVFLFGERITLRKVVSIVMAFTGCILVTGMVTHTLSFDMVGCAFALGSGISYAAYTVGTKLFLDRGYSEGTTLFYMFMIGTVLCVPFVDMGAMCGRFDPDSVVNLIAIGVFMTLVPYALVAYALKKGNAVKVNLLGLMEVVFAALVGFVFYGETIAVPNLVGMVLVVSSVILMNLDKHDMDT